MFEVNAFNVFTRALSHRNFELSTTFGSLGSAFEAIRVFSTGDYYLFTLELERDTPLRLEIFQDGHHTVMEFAVLTSIVDVRNIVEICDNLRFPYSW